MDPKEIKRRLQLAEGDRQRFEPMFDDAMRLTMPGRKRFHTTGATERGDDIFDETGANAVAEFVSRMQAGLMPTFTQFLRLEASSDVDARDRDAVNRDLDEITAFAFEEIWASNFAQESAETLYDMAISTGTMMVEDGGADGAIRNRCIPITELHLERGADDGVGGQFRVTTVKASMIEARYPRAKIGPRTRADINAEGDKELKLVEYTKTGKGGDSTYTVMVSDHDEIIIERQLTGPGSNPFLSVRWQTTAGEVWGRGPLLNALGAIRTTNLMVELVLENAAMSIVGVYQTDNDGIVNADNIQLLPGTILSKEIGSMGLEPVKGPGTQFNLQDVVLGDQRVNIKRALFNDMLSDPNKTPATATEVVERMADLAHRTSAGFGRVFYEFLVPYMRRVLHILEKRGDIKLPVKNGRAIKFNAVSPVAQAQQARDLQTLIQDYQIKATLFGPQAATASYELKALLPWLNNRIGLDRTLFASPEKVLKSLEESANAMAQMQAMEQGMPK